MKRPHNTQRLLAPKDNLTAIGTRFEHKVEALYRNLGYRVSHDVTLRGKQTDLVAVRFTPARGLERLLIECKHHECASVGIDTVDKFIHSLSTVIEREGISAGVLVTNTRFTRSAKERVRNLGTVALITEQDLQLALLDPTDAYIQSQLEYKTQPISNDYIRLRAEPTASSRQDASLLDSHEQAESVDAEELLLYRIIDERPSITVLQGDFGAGKTTLLERVKQALIEQYLNATSNIRPVLFRLKEFSSSETLDEFVQTTLQREIWQRLSMTLFWQKARLGEFALLLDGFDEMALRGSKEGRTHELQKIAPLLLSGSSSVLTCRPTYFVSDREMHYALSSCLGLVIAEEPQSQNSTKSRLATRIRSTFVAPMIQDHSYDSYNVKPLDKDSILLYLESKKSALNEEAGATPDEVYAFITSIYDLADLITRPLLLGMITETVLAGCLDLQRDQSRLTASTLYDTYTSASLERDWIKGGSRQLISIDERRSFVSAIALAMFDNDILEVQPEQIERTINNMFAKRPTLRHNLKHLNSEAVAMDVRLCAFMNRRASGSFSFTQTSFFNFFVGQYLHEQVCSLKADKRLLQPLPSHFTYFMGGFLFDDEHAKQRYFQMIKSTYGPEVESVNGLEPQQKRALRENLFSALLHAGLMSGPLAVSDIRCSNRTVSRLDLSNISLKKSTLENVKWQNSELRRVRFENVDLNDCDFCGVMMKDACTLDCRVSSSSFQDLTCVESILLASGRGACSDSIFKDCAVSLSGEWRISNSSFHGCNVDITCKQPGRLEGTRFEGGSVRVSLDPDPERNAHLYVQLNRCKFDNCSDLLLVLSKESFDSCTFRNSRGLCVINNWTTKVNEEQWEEVDGLILLDAALFRSSNVIGQSTARALAARYPDIGAHLARMTDWSKLGLSSVQQTSRGGYRRSTGRITRRH